ncbi:hypothetical protein O9H85_24740 [Paenibacillus filicis]|uniref:Uncharacterized protein n=1 Tax=Paenibacillus gyeongsangnamensis TaxID=3388067 RepID=A0ABT4QFC0_9BACL|nr:hypothetical protein [Paenibacillus filicis]MCZ8515555.1 hypothetical protein [Paenibacillus filicis]
MQKCSDPLPEFRQEAYLNQRIGHIEIFQNDCALIDAAVGDSCKGCSCGMLKISSRGLCGWGEYVLPGVEKPLDLVRWASVLMQLKGLTVEAGLRYVGGKREAWGSVRAELAESALLDLAQRLSEPPELKLSPPSRSLERPSLIDRSQAYFSC